MLLDIAGLVRGAAAGDRRAWERLVDQYARLIWSMTAEFKLVESDAADVAQTTWLRLLEHIDRIEYPDRVGSWLAATARNECLRSLAARKRVVLAQDDEVLTGVVASTPEVDERILADERDQVVRDALSRLPSRWQRLLELLMADPPASYADISMSWSFRSGASGRPGDDAWPSYASCCRHHEPSVAASTHRPPEASTSGKASRTSASRSGTNSSTASGRRAASSAGAGHGDVCSRHPQALLRRGGVDHHWQAGRDRRAPGTAALPLAMRRRSRGPSSRRTAQPRASHAGP